MSESTPGSFLQRNGKTGVALAGLPVRGLPALEAFAAVYDRLRSAAAAAVAPVSFVAALDPDGHLVAETTLVDGEALTIGRHEQCRFRLPDGDVSLRHLVAHVRLADGAAPAVTRLWDLHTAQPFHTEDGMPTSAVIAEGPLFVTVGSYTLLFVPVRALLEWPVNAGAAWDALPTRQFLDRRIAAVRGASTHAAPSSRRGAVAGTGAGGFRERPISVITHVRAPAFVGTDGGPGIAWGEVVIEHERGTIAHRVSAEQVDRGLLLGRYSRCQLGLVHDEGLSRVHLLLVRVDDDVLAIDTASTNGTLHEGRDLDLGALALRERDALLLGSDTVVRWRRLSVARA